MNPIVADLRLPSPHAVEAECRDIHCPVVGEIDEDALAVAGDRAGGCRRFLVLLHQAAAMHDRLPQAGSRSRGRNTAPTGLPAPRLPWRETRGGRRRSESCARALERHFSRRHSATRSTRSADLDWGSRSRCAAARATTASRRHPRRSDRQLAGRKLRCGSITAAATTMMRKNRDKSSDLTFSRWIESGADLRLAMVVILAAGRRARVDRRS